MNWTQNVLNNLVAFILPIIGIATLIFLVVQSVKLIKGNEGGSVGKLITGFIIFIIVAALVVVTKNFGTLGENFSGGLQGIIDKTNDTVNDILK